MVMEVKQTLLKQYYRRDTQYQHSHADIQNNSMTSSVISFYKLHLLINIKLNDNRSVSRLDIFIKSLCLKLELHDTHGTLRCQIVTVPTIGY